MIYSKLAAFRNKPLIRNIFKGIVSYVFVPLAASILFFSFLGILYMVVQQLSSGTLLHILLGLAIATAYILATWGVIRAYKACKLVNPPIVGWGIVCLAFLSGFGCLFATQNLMKQHSQVSRAAPMTSRQWAEGALNAALCEKPPCSHQSIENMVGPERTEIEWRRLAENGDKKAQSEQCGAHGFHNDVDSDYYKKIVSWCRSDAEEGNIQAEYLLGDLYARGQGGLSQSWEEAYFWHAVRILDNIPSTERDGMAKHLTPMQIVLQDERVIKWKEKLCASHPAERNAIVMRDWHCKNQNKQ